MTENKANFIYNFYDGDSNIRVIENEENQKYRVIALTNGALDLDKAIEFTEKYFDTVLILSAERKGINMLSEEYSKNNNYDLISTINNKRKRVDISIYKVPEIRKNGYGEYYIYEENLNSNKKYFTKK